MATGKYVLFLGADDKLLINLQELSNILVREDTIYYGDVEMFPSNKIYGGKFSTTILLNRNICHQCIFYPIEVFSHFQFDKKYKYMADYVMNLELWSSKKFNFIYINKIISMYNTSGLSGTIIDNEFKKKSFSIIYKYYGICGIFIKILNPFRNFVDNKNILKL
jgi:hypothetical protein